MPSTELTSSMRHLFHGVPALERLPDDVVTELGAAVQRVHVSQGDYLFHQGDPRLEKVFVLLTATAEVLVGPPETERTVSLAQPGQLLGFLSVFSAGRSPASARIVRSGEILSLPTSKLRSLAERHPEVAQLLAATMAERLQNVLHDVMVESSHARLQRFETFPFRRRVGEVMSHSVPCLAPDDTVETAARAMGRSGEGAVLVTDARGPVGIVTERDLVARVLASGSRSTTGPLRDVMTSPVHAVHPGEYLYKAMGLMRARRVLFLPVVDNGRPVGLLSIRDLLALSSRHTLLLLERIENAASLLELAEVRGRSHEVATSLLCENTPALEVSAALSALNRDIHRRVVEVCLRDMEVQARGRPPAPFCFLLMGSHGRGENHFATDQDHGMIIADSEPSARPLVDRFFQELGERVTEGLTRVGFPRCEGDVMSSNPMWRRTLSEWRQQLSEWFADPDAHVVRRATIFFDFIPAWGDSALADELRRTVQEGVRQNHRLVRLLFLEAAHHKVPLTLFKGFVTEKSGPGKGQLDVKSSGLRFVAECTRILALLHGVAETGTVARVEALEALGVIPRDEGRFIRNAYESFFRLILTSQAEALRIGAPPGHHVKPAALPIEERYLLRLALEATERLQTLVHARIHTPFVPGLAPPQTA